MKYFPVFVSIVSFFLVAVPALSQSNSKNGGSIGNSSGAASGTGNDAGPNKGTGAPATSVQNPASSAIKVSDATRLYVSAAAIGDLFEVESSKIALRRSASNELKVFAKEMIQQHGESMHELKSAILKTHLDVIVSAKLDRKHQKLLDALDHASEDDFKSKFIVAQVAAHEDALDLQKQYAMSGDNQDLKGLAAQTVTVVQTHLNRLATLAKDLHIGTGT